MPDLLNLPPGVELSDRLKAKLHGKSHVVRGGIDVPIAELPDDPEFQAQANEFNALVREIIARAGTPKPDFVVSETSRRTRRTVPVDGRTVVVPGDDTEWKVVEVIFDDRDGSPAIEQDVVEPEAVETSRSWIDKREEVRALKEQALNLRRLAGQVNDETGIDVEDLEKQATAKVNAANAILTELRETIPPGDWRGYDIAGFEELSPAVHKALELVHTGDTQGLHRHYFTMTREERYQLHKRATPEDERWFEALSDMVDAEGQEEGVSG